MATDIDLSNQREHRAILGVCILAAFADGRQDDRERARLERIVSGFADDQLDLPAIYQQVLGGKLTLPQVTPDLKSGTAKALAYEMAVCVCNADGVLSPEESQFLGELRQALELAPPVVAPHEEAAQSLATHDLGAAPPLLHDAGPENEIDKMILHAAILNGALQIMPHTLATMAIVPLQMRLVYKIGKFYGYDLDAGHLKDFLATVGVGLTSQVVERFAGRLVQSLTRVMAGGLMGGLAGQAADSAVGFASTYALGQVARKYYAGGRTLTTAQLKETFTDMLAEAHLVSGRYSGDIAQQARTVNVAELLPLTR